MKIKLKHFLWLFLVFVQIAAAQESISGKVTDKKGLPIPGVNIIVKGKNVSAQTDFDGIFKIAAKKGEILVVSYVSYNTVEVPAANNIKIELIEIQNELEAVVVVGYGTQSKRNLTDNIARVTAKDIQQIPVSNVQNALVGKLAGVQITQTNGKVDGGINIRVRGAASISAGTQPLYVLDGIPLINDDESSNGAPTNPLLTLSTNEIESIDVLKDASSAAIYGARGANGVVLITTKKGREGKGTFTVNLSQGVSEATHKRKWLNAKQYVELLQEAGRNVNDLESVEDELEYLSQGTDWRNGEVDTDWQDIALRTGYTTDADFSASGGDEKTKYFFSGAYNNTTGIVDSNTLERFTARTNVSHKVTDRLTLGMNLGFSRSLIHRVQDDNSFSSPLQSVAQAPISPARLEDGSANPNTEYSNYLLAKDNTFWKTIMRRLTGKVFAEFRILNSLKFNSDFSYDLLSQTEDYWQGKNAPFMATDGAVFATSVNTENYVSSNYFTYDQTFAEKHNLNVVAGMEFNKYNRRYQDVNSIYFSSDDFQTVDGGAEVNEGHGNETDYAFVSQFGRLNYAYMGKYLLKASIRRDGSSRFGKNERFGVFPAFSAGWVISQEDFLKNSNVLTNLKVKGSWGKLGNAEIGNFASRQLYRPNPYNLKSGLTFDQPGNDDLTWEKSAQTDFGIEVGFLNRFTLEADYYQKDTDGLLFEVPLPISSGAASINKNIGKIRSNGFEVTLNTKNIDTENFKWNTSFNITTNESKVKSLPNDNRDIIVSYNINRVGENISSFYLVEYAGVDPENGDALFYKNTKKADGSLDRTKTSDYSEAQRIIAGNPFPTLMSGLTNTILYKGFDFTFTFQGEWGASIYNSAGIYQSTAADYFDNQTADQLNRWQKPGDITDVPQARFGGSNGTQDSSRYLDKADFVRLRNLTLGYTLPKDILKDLGMSSLRVYFTAVNLLTFTNYEGNDPEARRDDTGIGEDFYSAPPARTTAIGVNFNFKKNKMKANKLILFIFLAAFFTSCENELDLDPKQREDADTTLSTETGVTNVLTGTYALAANGNAYGGRVLLYADLLGVTGVLSTTDLRWRGTFGELRQMYSKNMLSDNVIIEGTYARLYEIINASNTVIENIDKVKDPDRQAVMIGEANFLRSLAYFDLVRFFAKPYESGETNNQLGVVIRPNAIYDFSVDLSKERSTVEEVYKVIIDGLNLAYTNLPEENGFYADKYAAQALLARVYLQQGRYDLARDAANDVIENSGHGLSQSYAAAFNHDTDQIEDVFAIQITKQTGVNDAVTFYASEGNGGRGGDFSIRDAYLNKFSSPDDRADFIYENEDNGRILTSKYTDQFADVGIIRLAEMYLIRAEGNLEEGTAIGNTPLDDINIIRGRAHADALTAVTIDDILLERELELGMEGFLIHDIKRTKRSILTETPDGDPLLLTYDADKLVFPIPLKETDANKKITQNPGYRI